ncbi:hypothetical protein PINS_up000450 [Pythium insidiosum]|nr:hypothetical protein PINS_up000450 [Pythium insidiosum]
MREGTEMHSGLIALTLGLPRWVLVLIWWYILCYQLVNAAVLSALAHLYWQADVRDSMIWFLQSYFLFSEAARFLSQMSRVVFTTFAVLAVIYYYGALSMIWYSVRRRQLCYDSGAKRHTVLAKPDVDTPHDQRSWRLLPSVVRWLRNGVKTMVQVWESFGIRGRYFVSGLIVREAFETTLQTIQASWAAKCISSRAINNLYVGLIFVNCCASYLYGYVFRAEQARRRLACVLTDLTIDFVWGTVIPVMMFLPYVRLYYAQNQVDVNVVWPESAEKEVAQMLALSVSAFVLSVFPFVSSVTNIRGVRRFLARARVSSRGLQRVVPLNGGNSSLDALPAVPTSESRREEDAQQPVNPRKSVSSPRWSVRRLRAVVPWSHSLLHGLMVAHGLIILIIACVSASQSKRSSGATAQFDCMHRVYPWLSMKEACAGRRINCTAVGFSGSREELTAALELFDEASLSMLVLTDCPALDIPPTIRRFRGLVTISIRYSAIDRWAMDAALTTAHFSSLQTLRMVETTLQRPPEGIFREPLPRTLEWVSLSNTDVTSFIHDVGSNWRDVRFLYIDYAELDQVPAVVFASTSLLELSLCGNPFTHFEFETTANLQHLTQLWLDSSAFEQLPNNVWELAHHVRLLSLQYTNVSMYPAWLQQYHVNDQLRIDAFGTPLCNANANTSAIDIIPSLSCVEVVNF